jgi:uncharacterized protein (TIGR03083 family)
VLSAGNLESITSEGRRLVAAVRRGPARPVPQYPGWTLTDLASHTGSVYGRTVLVCRELPQERISAPRLPEGKDPADWLEETLEEMVAFLGASDPSTQAWAFGLESSTIGFWERRMVIETGVHRWDASDAFGEARGLTRHVARAGLDEFAAMWLPRLGAVPTLDVVAMDLGESWRYGTADPVDRVEGTASDLYLRLMARRSPVELPAAWAAAVDGLPPPGKPSGR